MVALKEYSVEVFNLSAEYIAEQVNALPQVNVIRRSHVATLDPSDSPRSTEAKVESLKSQWPDARFDAVFDHLSGQTFIFVS